MNNTKEVTNTIYDALSERVKNYINAIRNIGFAQIERESLNTDIGSPQQLIDAVCTIIDAAEDLNRIFEQSPSSVYIAGADGTTLRINRGFEEMSDIYREKLIGRNVEDIERDGIYHPSAVRLALHEKKRIMVQQNNLNNKKFVVTGTPIVDENEKIVRVVTDALLIEDIKKLGLFLANKKDQENATARNEKIIAESSQMKAIIQLADLVKDTGSTIIIEGETGAGKDVLARYIHETSKRKKKKMIAINCGAIPEALLESELFGYEGGAFTGADKHGKPGLVEVCEGGTILLDEISEMPLSLQVKLLHFLQNRKIIRVGGTEEIDTDVAVIVTTNKNLENLVANNQFREDLYYRLNIVPIVIPPLRERKEDIFPLAEHFFKKYSRVYDKEMVITDECKEFIKSNEWKGNVRELENFIERWVVTEGNVRALGDIIRTTEPGDSMEDIERKTIMRAYKKYGSTHKVAKALGMSQSTVYRKIKKYMETGEDQ